MFNTGTWRYCPPIAECMTCTAASDPMGLVMEMEMECFHTLLVAGCIPSRITGTGVVLSPITVGLTWGPCRSRFSRASTSAAADKVTFIEATKNKPRLYNRNRRLETYPTWSLYRATRLRILPGDMP
jgi:hypothetical protein